MTQRGRKTSLASVKYGRPGGTLVELISDDDRYGGDATISPARGIRARSTNKGYTRDDYTGSFSADANVPGVRLDEAMIEAVWPIQGARQFEGKPRTAGARTYAYSTFNMAGTLTFPVGDGAVLTQDLTLPSDGVVTGAD